MILESHSLKTAFTRYHLTTPEVLRELGDDTEQEKAALAQIRALEEQLRVIDASQASDYRALGRVVGAALPEADGASGGIGSATPTS
jgi:hypothetical protein